MISEKIKAYMNWSGGKDSSLCLYKVLNEKNYSVEALLTSMNVVHDRVSMHGVRRALLEAQAASIGLPLHTIELPEQPSMNEYETILLEKVLSLKAKGFRESIFGDIFLEDLRTYREQKLAPSGITCAFPLWRESTEKLMEEFINAGFKGIVVCVNEKFLDRSFCGRIIDDSFVKDLPPNVDVCGENGEYHSFVFDGPIFRQPISFKAGEVIRRTYASPKNGANSMCTADVESECGFYFCDLIP